MKCLIKRFARWVLSKELKWDAELIERLRGYGRPHIPELKSDGTDQSDTLQMMLDINCGAYIPEGELYMGCCIEAGDATITGEVKE